MVHGRSFVPIDHEQSVYIRPFGHDEDTWRSIILDQQAVPFYASVLMHARKAE